METEGRRGTEQQRSSMEAGRGRSKNGRREEVVKPKTRWNKERRLEVLGSVYDSQGRMPRFVRCAETLPNGSRRQVSIGVLQAIESLTSDQKKKEEKKRNIILYEAPSR